MTAHYHSTVLKYGDDLMKSAVILLFIFLAYHSDAFGQDDLVATDISGRYKISQPKGYGEGFDIWYDGKIIHSVLPKYQKEVLVSDWMGEDTKVLLIYDHLAERGRLVAQPRAFEDILGDGVPNLVFIEQPDTITNHGPWSTAIRVFSLIEDEVVEGRPYFEWIGEAIHFDDFNKDGVFEIVNTDHERYFLYSQRGFPISPCVLIYDPG